jgi:hypothetical protein
VGSKDCRDATGNGLFFVQIFSLFLSGAVLNVPQIICVGRFMRDATEDALKAIDLLRELCSMWQRGCGDALVRLGNEVYRSPSA